MKLYQNITQLIGNTPLVELNNLKKILGLKARLFAKVEYFNPGHSVKDRIALAMIEDAEKKGLLKPDSVIIEPTSGNTGIGIAMVGAAKGYQVILVMPETMSVERRKLMGAYGAKIVLTEGPKGMKGAIAKANEIKETTKNGIILAQFENPANPMIHYLTTGPEIYEAVDAPIDAFVTGVGTGGSISGIGKYLKEKNEKTKVIAVEPVLSPVLSGGNPGPHPIQGIGAGFIPNTLNTSIYDEIIKVDGESAYKYARLLAKNEGILSGISSGAALSAAVEVALREDYLGKTIVVLLMDTGERYLSTQLYPDPTQN
jgi:cysteine synthase A